jgi:hypothetical protein
MARDQRNRRPVFILFPDIKRRRPCTCGKNMSLAFVRVYTVFTPSSLYLIEFVYVIKW